MSSTSLRPTPQPRGMTFMSFQCKISGSNGTSVEVLIRGLTIFTELSVKIFRQMVVVFFFRTENRNTVELYHLQDIGKSFAFTRDWHWKSTQMVQKISVVLACVHPFFLAPIYFPVPATQATVVSVKAEKRFQYLARYYLFPKKFHRIEPLYLNFLLNYRVFLTMISAPFRTESVPNRDLLDSNSICKNPPFISYSGFCGHLSVKRIDIDLCK